MSINLLQKKRTLHEFYFCCRYRISYLSVPIVADTEDLTRVLLLSQITRVLNGCSSCCRYKLSYNSANIVANITILHECSCVIEFSKPTGEKRSYARLVEHFITFSQQVQYIQNYRSTNLKFHLHVSHGTKSFCSRFFGVKMLKVYHIICTRRCYGRTLHNVANYYSCIENLFI